jgi:hypothetical protein
MQRPVVLLTFILGALTGSHPVFAADTQDAPLEAVESKDFDTLLQTPAADWTRYETVHVALPEVSFRKNWQRDQNRFDSFHVRDRDVARIQNDMAELVQEILQEQFAREGWLISEQAGAGMLVLQPNIVDLDIAAPDVPGNALRETYTDTAGSMTLDLVITDGTTGDPLLRVVDHKEDPRDTMFEWRKRPNNLHQARILVRGWARELTDLLGSRDA